MLQNIRDVSETLRAHTGERNTCESLLAALKNKKKMQFSKAGTKTSDIIHWHHGDLSVVRCLVEQPNGRPSCFLKQQKQCSCEAVLCQFPFVFNTLHTLS